MLRGVGAAVAFLLAMQALPAQAQSGDLPVCRTAYKPAWERVSGGNDLAAMDRAIAAIPVGNCPSLHAEASGIRAKTAARIESARLAEVRRIEGERAEAEEKKRAADAAAAAASARAAQAARDRDAAQARELQRVKEEAERKADSNAWSVAKQSNTAASYSAYLSVYPYGAYASDARRARDDLANVKVSVCNNSTADKIYAGVVYQRTASSSWRGDGWYSVERGKCSELFTTATREFYVHRLETDGRAWERASSEMYGFCAHKTAAFGFDWSGTCPTGTESANYRKVSIPAGVTSFSANVIDPPQRAADIAAWDNAKARGSIAGYDTYLAAFPNGMYAENARSARKALQPLRVSVCNNTGKQVGVAVSYQKPDAGDQWTYEGWFIVENTKCNVVLETRNSYFYLRAEAQDGSGDVWTGSEGTKSLCIQYPGPYDFTIAASANCPTGVTTKPFKEVKEDVSQGTFKWNLVK